MSTEWVKIKSANKIFPDDTLEFISGASGYYFFIKLDNTNKGIKFWFKKEDWNELKQVVDAILNQ